MATKEEELDEAYQHLRITFSEFLTSPDGIRVKEQINLLRQARHRLPLFELQRRLDKLLYPIVRQWIKREDDRAPSKRSVLLRDCLQIKKEGDCIEGCTWTQDAPPMRQCLIHTTKTERYLDPVNLMASRLTDELLRTFGKAMEILNQAVPRLKPLGNNELRYENSALVFSAAGRGTQSLYDMLGYSERQPTRYTTGLTYPEEVGIDEASMELPADWVEALYRINVSAYLARDPQALINQVIQTITKSDRQFRKTDAEWKALANELKTTIIFTQYDSMSHRIEPVEQLQGSVAEPRTYLVVDVDGIPLQNKKTKGFTLREDELPASLRAWLS